MKSRYSRIITGTTIAVLACTSVMQLASAAASRASGESTATLYVECLNDYLVVNYQYSRVRVNHGDGSNYSIIQKGEATDSYGNTWKFSGHYQFKTKYSENPTVEHVIDRNILISNQSDMPNLQVKTTSNFVEANGEVAVDMTLEESSCIAQ